MEIIQKKGSVEHSYRFEERFVNFKCDSKTEGFDIDVFYSDISKKTAYSVERNLVLRNIGYLWLVLGAVLVTMSFYTDITLSRVTPHIILGLGCLAWSYYSTIRYTVLPSESGNVFVIQGRDHDRVVGELRNRRKEYFLKTYGDIDTTSTAEREIKKYEWLVDMEVLTREEAEQKIAAVKISEYDNDDPTNNTFH